MLRFVSKREQEGIVVVAAPFRDKTAPTEASVTSKNESQVALNDGDVGTFIVASLMKSLGCEPMLASSVQKLSLERTPKAFLQEIYLIWVTNELLSFETNVCWVTWLV